MDIVTQERNYIPIDLLTRFHACQRARESRWKVSKVCSFYHVKRSSLFRWLHKYDGIEESLIDKTHKPLSPHPKSLSEEVITKVINLRRRNPEDSYMEIWLKMHRNHYVISLSSVLRVLKRAKEYIPYVSNAKKKHDKSYHTPKMLGEKWQIDVKYVPQECAVGNIFDDKFYQHTILDECNRKRFLYFSREHSMYETSIAIRKAIEFFGYSPLVLQSDNGFEFSDQQRRKTKGVNIRQYPNILETTCIEFGIVHKFIRPRTPERNGFLPLRSSSSGDEKYILKGGISDPNGSNFDPYYTPTNAIKRTIKYASSAAYNNLQNGDIVTETSTKFSNMGHSAILYDCNKHASGNLEGRSTYIQTIEAVGDGVQFGFLDDDRMVSFGVVIIRPKNAYSSDVYDALNFCYDQLGKPYYLPLENGTAQTSRYSQHWYCSELVYAAYEDTGVTIAYASSGGWVWPIDILWSTRVDFVCYNKTLDTEYMGKTNGKFKLRVYNRTGSTRTVYYNSKKCFKNDAKGWSNLHDWQNNYVSISNGSYADILISSNWFADCAAISYTYSGKRYITYVQFNALSDSTLRVGIFKNVKNAYFK